MTHIPYSLQRELDAAAKLQRKPAPMDTIKAVLAVVLWVVAVIAWALVLLATDL